MIKIANTPTSGANVRIESSGKSNISPLRPFREHVPADQHGDADQHGECIVIEIPGLQRATAACHDAHGDETPSGPTPSIKAPSPPFQSTGPIAKAGRTKILSYNSSKYHLLSRELITRPGTVRRFCPGYPGARYTSDTQRDTDATNNQWRILDQSRHMMRIFKRRVASAGS